MEPLEEFFITISPGPLIPAELKIAVGVATVVGSAIASSPEAAQILFWVKVFALVLTVLFGVGILALIIKMNLFGVKMKAAKSFIVKAHPAKKEKLSREWEKVKNRLRRGNDAEDRLAVIEADQLLDLVLKRAGFKGETMGDRLEKVKPWQLKSIEGVWNAHKIRNRLVHEPQVRLGHYEAETAVKIFENALKELEFLD